MTTLPLRPGARPVLFLCLLAHSLLPGRLPGAGRADPKAEERQFREATSIFRSVLYDPPAKEHVRPLARVRDLFTSPPGDTLLVVLGKTQLLDNELAGRPSWLRTQFIEKGGAVLVATDQRTPNWGFVAQDLGVMISGRFVSTDPQSDWAYKPNDGEGLRFCPKLVVSDSSRAGPTVFNGLRRIVTNKPSYIDEPFRGAYRMLAVLPPNSEVDGARLPHSPLFALGATWGDGKVLVMADHSVFINCMLLAPNSDNFEFARNCREWLAGPASARRKYVLFIEDGQVRTDFEVLYEEINEPFLSPGEQLVELANNTLAAIEEDDTANKVLREFGHDRDLDLWAVFAVVFSLGVLLYGLARLNGLRHRLDPGTPLFANALTRLAPAGGAIDQRTQNVLKDRNFYEAARAVVRQFFAAAIPGQESGVRSQGSATQDESSLATAAFPVKLSGPQAGRADVRRLVRWLWRLAHGDAPERVSSFAFADLLNQLADLRAALATGELRLSFR